MTVESLYKKLVSVARANPPSEEVPYAFESRVMARLRAQSARALDPWLLLARGLWRAIVPCCGVAAVIICWSLLSDRSSQDFNVGSADDLEVALVDSIDMNDNVEDSW